MLVVFGLLPLHWLLQSISAPGCYYSNDTLTNPCSEYSLARGGSLNLSCFYFWLQSENLKSPSLFNLASVISTLRRSSQCGSDLLSAGQVISEVTAGQLGAALLLDSFSLALLISQSMSPRKEGETEINPFIDGLLTADHAPQRGQCECPGNVVPWPTEIPLWRSILFFFLNHKKLLSSICPALLGALVCPCYFPLDFKSEAEAKLRIWEMLCKMGPYPARPLLARETIELRSAVSKPLCWVSLEENT